MTDYARGEWVLAAACETSHQAQVIAARALADGYSTMVVEKPRAHRWRWLVHRSRAKTGTGVRSSWQIGG